MLFSDEIEFKRESNEETHSQMYVDQSEQLHLLRSKKPLWVETLVYHDVAGNEYVDK